MIRTCLSIYMNASSHFRHVFATNGFLIILPTILKVYSNTQTNPIIKNAIEFACIHFYAIHRIPFILQLVGSVAQILDTSGDSSNTIDTNKIHAGCFLNILLAMEANKAIDSLAIMDLIRNNEQDTW